jgi:preprotein translocase subunit Sec61beta
VKIDRRSAPAIAMIVAALLIVALIFSGAWILVAGLG